MSACEQPSFHNHTGSMNHRLNSAIHFISAGYWGIVTILGTLFGPAPFRSSLGFRSWVGTGLALITLDLLAGAKQSRGPTEGRILSIVLHFSVATLIVALITYEFLQTQPRSPLAWFKGDNYWFIAALALVRVSAGAGLLVCNEDRLNGNS